MIEFLNELKNRNESLFYFGLICFIFSLLFLVFTKTTNTTVMGVNAWFKPFKFAFSIFTFVWTMAWYCSYLPNFNSKLFSVSMIILLGFEIIYIAIQAGRGQLSHFNISSGFYTTMYSLMAIAATLVTLYTAYVGVLFFKNSFPNLTNYYLWAIRLGIVVFVIFSFQGFTMGTKLNHSVGAINDNSNWFIVGWSKTVGDLRVAHFIGMHALQLLPICSFYVLKSLKSTIVFFVIYLLLAMFTFFQALKGKPLLSVNIFKKDSFNTPTK